ncbi:hypothetical protein [Lysobacter sp. Root690]|uniref:hypothetical protein n=1 Tax=Lysobacter sp. Root690 TaxID=1736588 RepID=UPI0012FCCAC4|nr:hypothetical protein [Lysobacter sp. Root690]
MAALTFTGSDGGESSCGCFAAQAPNKPMEGNSIATASQAGIRVLTIDVSLPVVPRLGASDSLSVEYASEHASGKPEAPDRRRAIVGSPRVRRLRRHHVSAARWPRSNETWAPLDQAIPPLRQVPRHAAAAATAN